MKSRLFGLFILYCIVSNLFAQHGVSVITGDNKVMSSSIGIVGSSQISITSVSLNQGIQQVYAFDGFESNDGIAYDILLATGRDLTLDILNDSEPPFHIIIVTRDGQKVYENTNYGNDWQGTNSNGAPLPDGAYYFILRTKNRTKPIKGSVTLIR